MTSLSAKDKRELQARAVRLVPDTLLGGLKAVAKTPQEMSEEEAAFRLGTTDIVERFSTNDYYNELEQSIINHAIEILAEHMVSQEEDLLMTSSNTVKNFVQLKLATSSREVFAVLFLNSENRLIKYEEMFIGTLNVSAVYPREVMKRALELDAANIILTHNHPSGVLESSSSDDQLTDRLMKIGKVFNIQVLDHLIVSPKGVMSYAEHGKMPFNLDTM